MGLIPQLTDAGKAMMIKALTGKKLNFTGVKLGNADAPSSLNSGDYWYDTENMTLHQYLNTWVASETPITVGTSAPAATEAGDLWYNPDTGTLYKCSDGWVEQQEKITCNTNAPSNSAIGDYWYDTANSIFYVYSRVWNSLTTETIICSTEAPANVSAGDYWYSTSEALLKVCTKEWNNAAGVNISAGDTAPEAPADSDYWYDTAAEQLKVCHITSTTPAEGEETQEPQQTAEWTNAEKVFTYGETAPTNPSDGDWWYDTTTPSLKAYETVWVNDTEHTFTYGSTPPDNPSDGDWWYDTALHVYGANWTLARDQDFTYGSAAPRTPSAGDWWYNTSNHTLYEFGLLWATDEADVFTYARTKPEIAYSNDYWYDTAEGELKEYKSGWFVVGNINFSYGNTPPYTPSAGDWWYSASEKQLYEYTGAQWTVNYSTITCSISEPNTADVLTDLINPMLVAPITEILKGSNYVSLTTKLTNAELTRGFQWSETGVFAQIDGGPEELYAYCNAGDLYDYIPANDSGRTLDVLFTMLVMVGDAEDVTATIGEAALYASKAALDEHLHDNKNPHQVTAEDVGLGNVKNVAPEDMTVSYTVAASLEEPESGEKLSVFFGKVKKAIATLITHLKASNPHGITPDKIGAAATNHTHYVSGVYTGDGTSKRLISLDFTPSAVIVIDGRGRMTDDSYVYGGIAVGTKGVRIPSCTAISHETTWSTGHTALLIATGGFYVSYYSYCRTNTSSETYRYIAFK